MSLFEKIKGGELELNLERKSYVFKGYPNNFEKIEIGLEDFGEAKKHYEELLALIEEYKKASKGRKQLAEQITKQYSELIIFYDFLEKTLNKNYAQVPSSDCKSITDVNLAMRVILRLANAQEDIYRIKSFGIDQDGVTTSRDNFQNEILIIGTKDTLDKLNGTDRYDGYEIKIILTEIMLSDKPLIVAQYNYFDSMILPRTFSSQTIFGEGKNMTSFTQSGPLAQAINAFLEFVEENGYDIKGIDEDTLVANILQMQEEKRARDNEGPVHAMKKPDNN